MKTNKGGKAMNTYKVEIKEILSRVVIVEAENEEDAKSKIENDYKNEEIVLDSGDYEDTQIKVLNLEEKFVTAIPYGRFKSDITIGEVNKDGSKRYVINCDDTKMYLKPNYDWQDYLDMLELQGKYSDNIDDKIEKIMADFVDFIEYL